MTTPACGSSRPSSLQLNPISSSPPFMLLLTTLSAWNRFPSATFLPSLTTLPARSRTQFPSTTFLPSRTTLPARSWTPFSFDRVPTVAVDISSYDQPHRPATSTPSNTFYSATCHTDSSYTIGFLRAIPTLAPQWCAIRDSTLNSSFVYDSLGKGLLFLILSSSSVDLYGRVKSKPLSHWSARRTLLLTIDADCHWYFQLKHAFAEHI